MKKYTFYFFFLIFITTSYSISDELEKYKIINKKLFGLEHQGISDKSNTENLAYMSTKNKSRERLILLDPGIPNERDKLKYSKFKYNNRTAKRIYPILSDNKKIWFNDINYKDGTNVLLGASSKPQSSGYGSDYFGYIYEKKTIKDKVLYERIVFQEDNKYQGNSLIYYPEKNVKEVTIQFTFFDYKPYKEHKS